MKNGEHYNITAIDIKPLPVLEDDQVIVELAVRNTGTLTWTAGDYFAFVDLYDDKKQFVSRLVKEKGRATIPPGASELLLTRFKAPKANAYWLRAGVILSENITQTEEYFESLHERLYVQEKKKRMQVHGSYRLEAEYVDMAGDSQGAFVTEGGNLTNTVTVRTDFAVSEQSRTETFIHARQTDDPLVDKKNWSLEEFYTNFYSPHLDLGFGDFYPSFSDYSLNTHLEGFSAEAKASGFHIKPFIGRERQAENEAQYTRYVYGVRPEWNVLETFKEIPAVRNFTLGFNYVSTQDASSSLKSEHKSGVSDLDNRLFSGDAKLTVGDFNFETEYAGSRDDANAEDATRARKGNAFRAEGRYSSKWAWLWGKYQRLNSRFNSPLGFAIQDREEYYTRAIFRLLGEFLAFKPLYRFYHDNVDGRTGMTTKVQTPEFTFTVKPFQPFQLGFLKDFSVDYSYKVRDRKANDDSVDEEFITNQFTLSQKLWNMFFDVSFGHRNRDDDAIEINDAKSDTFSFGTRGSFEISQCRITPSFRYSNEKEKLVLSGNRDSLHSITGSLSAQIKYVDFDFYQTFLDSDRFVDNSDYKRVGSDYRLTYRFGGSYDKTGSLGYEVVDYNHQDNAKDFTEKRAYAKVEVRF